jgi:hypothetical protein
MSSWNNLNDIAKNKIWQQLYNSSYGVPTGTLLSFNNEAPGTANPYIFNSQLYSQDIPATSPTNYDSGTTVYLPNTSPQVAAGTKFSCTDPGYTYITKYVDLVLDSNDLTLNVCFWYKGANILYNNGSKASQVQNNLLINAIPFNFDPDGSYNPTLKIGGALYPLGNATFPWTFNVNSGIIEFTGDTVSNTASPTK